MKEKTQFKDLLTVYNILAAITLLVTLLSSILYISFYVKDDRYMSYLVFALPFVAIAVFAGLYTFKVTRKYASMALLVFNFLSFLFFIKAVYMYLSEVFYAGVTLEAFGDMKIGFVLSLLFYLAAFVMSNVLFYIKPIVKKEEIK